MADAGIEPAIEQVEPQQQEPIELMEQDLCEEQDEEVENISEDFINKLIAFKLKFSLTQKAIDELMKKFVPMLQNISSHSKKDELFYEIKYAFDNDKIDRRMAKDQNYNPPVIRNISKKMDNQVSE